ncbi:MAG: DsbA family protein [Patescibacteria group bacterium]
MSEKIPVKGNLFERIAPILLIVTIGLSFLVGTLWQKVKNLESSSKSPGTLTSEQRKENPGVDWKLSSDQAKKIKKVSSEDHIRGSDQAKVFLIEYSDLECPYCKSFHETVLETIEQYKGQVAWVYRHFPIDSIHSKADKEAEAVECAAELGGEESFWKLTDKIFEVTPSNNGLNLQDLPSLALAVGLNQAKFTTCLDSGKYKAKVESQYQSGIDAGVTGTPGNFVVNEKGDAWTLPGAVPFESVKSVIDQALRS